MRSRSSYGYKYLEICLLLSTHQISELLITVSVDKLIRVSQDQTEVGTYSWQDL